MNILELQRRAKIRHEPLHVGEWGTLLFRPDLGSQQEFIVGVIAAIEHDQRPHIKWLPTLAKLSLIYGGALTSAEAVDLLQGVEMAINSSFHESLSGVEVGTPHVRLVKCGYIATDDIESELNIMLKRQAGAIWQEKNPRGREMDDDWAYSVMRTALESAMEKRSIFVPGRSILIAGKNLNIGLDTGRSYGNIISARYASFNTIEKHIYSSVVDVTRAHRFGARSSDPGLFVVLPEIDELTSRKTIELLSEIEEMGVAQFSAPDPSVLAKKIESWANLC